MRTYKKVSDCPFELKKFIDEVNLLPKDDMFESIVNLTTKKFHEETTGLITSKNFDEQYLEAVKKYSANLRNSISQELYELVTGNKSIDDFFNVIIKLKRLINEKRALLTIIQSFEIFKGFNNPRQDFSLDKALSAFSFNQDSTLLLSSFRGIEILKSNKIPVNRLLICPICKDICWIKKTNAKTCGKTKCINDLQNSYKRFDKLKKKKLDEIKKKEREKWKNLDFSQSK